MKRDHTDLICDIGELSGLFTDATSLEAFLQRIVEMISTHMNSEVCSIYLFYEDSGELVLKATKGLKPEAIGKVRLKLGEGLTGMCVKELRPICVKNASSSPGYKYFPQIGEEPYESFLAVPICRGQNRIGAIVIQNSRKDFFAEDDIRVFRAMTSQLATTIETARALIDLEEDPALSRPSEIRQELKFIKGRIGSEGFAHGHVSVLDNSRNTLLARARTIKEILGIDALRKAVETTERQLEELQKVIEAKLADVASLIFTAQILMLKDQHFIQAMEALIRQGTNAPEAVAGVVEDYARRFDGLTNSYLREKKDDVYDIGYRLLENMIGADDHLDEFQNKILIARELFPSDILKYSGLGVKGLIILSGGITSHISILARSLELPVVITDNGRLLELTSDTSVILDAEQGNIHINPTSDIVASYRKREEQRAGLEKLKSTIKDRTQSKDGTRVWLLANINLLSDLKAAHDYKAEGIGLYRTEFPFIIRSNFPSEEEQFLVYRKLVEQMRGKEITFRTLDIGGDKVLSYFDYGKENNPFLGMRSIRFSLKHKDVFMQQLRAILRAGVKADLKIMFPMISSVDEFLTAKGLVRKAIDELKLENIPCHDHPPIGMMVELPAVLEIIDDLADEADFFSIGTNDFIQYMLAIDRTNEKVADLYLPHHPSVLRALQKVVKAAVARRKDVTICGDMAHDERYLPFFLGIGIRKLSIDSHFIPKIQKSVARLNLSAAQATAAHLLSLPTVQAISQQLIAET